MEHPRYADGTPMLIGDKVRLHASVYPALEREVDGHIKGIEWHRGEGEPWLTMSEHPALVIRTGDVVGRAE